MMLPVSIVAVLLFASSGISAEDEDGKHGWRDAMCELNNQTMFKELDACFRNEPKLIIEVQEHCAKEVFPTSNGNLVEFVTEACKNSSLFTKFDECQEEFEANSAYQEQMQTTPEVQECYENIYEKYEIAKVLSDLKAKLTES